MLLIGFHTPGILHEKQKYVQSKQPAVFRQAVRMDYESESGGLQHLQNTGDGLGYAAGDEGIAKTGVFQSVEIPAHSAAAVCRSGIPKASTSGCIFR